MYLKLYLYLTVLLFELYNCNKIGDWSADTNADKWRMNAKIKIDEVLKRKRNTNVAKNVILYLGNLQVKIQFFVFIFVVLLNH